jgi:hypothetical protein
MPRKRPTIILERPTKPDVKEINLRLDDRTAITIAITKALDAWKLRYSTWVIIG